MTYGSNLSKHLPTPLRNSLENVRKVYKIAERLHIYFTAGYNLKTVYAVPRTVDRSVWIE